MQLENYVSSQSTKNNNIKKKIFRGAKKNHLEIFKGNTALEGVKKYSKHVPFTLIGLTFGPQRRDREGEYFCEKHLIFMMK